LFRRIFILPSKILVSLAWHNIEVCQGIYLDDGCLANAEVLGDLALPERGTSEMLESIAREQDDALRITERALFPLRAIGVP
jgi:hypothetical protein